MDASVVCKFIKDGHCRYGKFCNFRHQDRKCETKSCDYKNCDLRHPKDCKFVLRNKKCTFGEFCSFEHDIGVILNFVKEKSDETFIEKLKKLENMIAAKDNEIEQLRKVISNANMMQLDGVDCSDITETETAARDNTTEEDANESELDFCRPGILTYSCDLCNFTTEHKKGLRGAFKIK